jgi:putative ABC transport system permease protein
MTTLWKKVIRDSWGERTRTVLVVLAMALGIAALAAVLSSYAILTRELNDGYLATNPASATLVTDAVDPTLLRAVASLPGIRETEARRTLSGRIEAGGGWKRLMLFVVADFARIRISRITPQRGAFPPATGEILIERDAVQVARARIGQNAVVEIGPGNASTLRVSGSVHDAGQAQARMENVVYGYITPATLVQLREKPYLDQVQIVVSDQDRDETHIREVAASVSRLLESKGHPVRRIEVPPPGRHPHADIMGLLLLIMATFGLLVLFLSGILVVNLLMALMASEVRLIGVMKAVGATRGQIAGIYLREAFLLGIAAIAVALPAGLWGGRLLCRYMAVFLNFDINSFAVPVWVFLLIAAVGLVVPLLSAAFPVWKGSAVSVQKAMTDFGVSGEFGTDAFDRALSRIGGAMRPLLLAMRNSFRRRTRLALTVATLSVGGLIFMSALNIRAAMINTLDRLFSSRKFDLSVSLAAIDPTDVLDRAIRRTPGIRRAEEWITSAGSFSGGSAMRSGPEVRQAPAKPASGGDGLHGGPAASQDRFTVIALPAESEFLQMEIVAGRHLRRGESGSLVVNNELASRARLEVGDRVNLVMTSDANGPPSGANSPRLLAPPVPSPMLWRVVGIAREPFSPAIAYVPLGPFPVGSPHGANSLRILLDRTDPASIERVKATLEQTLEREGARVRGSLSKAESRFGFDQHMLMIYVFLIVLSCILGAVGGLGIMTTMSINVLERRREMGVLRAIGAAPPTVWLIVVAEGMVIAVSSWALAGIVAWPLSRALGSLLVLTMFRTGLDFQFEWRGLLIWLAVSLVLGGMASFLPAWRASHRPVREALGYG